MTPSPGRELDAEVAEKVFGWKLLNEAWGPYRWQGDKGRNALPAFSTSIEDAWRVVDNMSRRNFYFDIDNHYKYHAQGYWEAAFGGLSDAAHHIGIADTAPMAICLAAIKAVGENRK